MDILLLGGCGYVGTVLTNELLKHGHHVTVVDTMWFGNYLAENPELNIIKADIRQIDKIPFEGTDAIIHLANIANDPSGDLNPKLTWEVNALATMALIEKAISHGAKQFIYASSGSVYGVSDAPEVTEALPLLPISDYNKTKMISERVLLSYSEKIVLQIVRPATVCGYSPRMRLDLSVNLLTMQALSKGVITVFGGNQTRPNIHIRDLINVYLHFLESPDSIRGIYNAGFENYSIIDIAKLVTRYVPAEIKVTASNDPRSYRLNSDKLLSTGFVPSYNIDYAIREITQKFNSGELQDDETYYNVKTMLKIKDID